VTDSSGASSLPFVPLQAVTYQIKATYGGSTTYSPSSDAQTLQVTPGTGSQAATTISLTLSNNEVSTQTFVTISATLKDTNGNTVPQKNLVFQFSSDGITWTNITTAITGSNGVAQSNYKPSQSGTLSIRAVFNGDTQYYQSQSNEETLVVGGNATTNVNIPWIWIIISVALVVAIAAIAIAMTKLRRNGNNQPPIPKKAK
jgi:hypothetical protein